MASYFQNPLNANHIPNFLAAKSKAGLRRKMALNNTKHKGFVKYFDIQYDPSTKEWVCWFFVTEDLKGLQDILEGDS